MATDTDGAANSFLRRQLSDGVRPFRYRGRIRALLGHPESGGVESDFPTLPVADFAQLHSQFAGEFEFPGNPVATTPRRVVTTADPAHVVRSGVGLPGTVAPPASFSGSPDQRGAPVAAQTGSWNQDAMDRIVVTPRSAVPARETQAGPVRSQNGAERASSPPKRHEVTIPAIREPQRSSMANGETRPLEIEPVRELKLDRTGGHSPAGELPPKAMGETLSAGLTSDPVERVSFAIPPAAHKVGGVRPIRTTLEPATSYPISGRPLPTPRVAPQDVPDGTVRAESGVRHGRLELRGRDAIPPVRHVSQPYRRHQLASENDTPGRSEAGAKASADATFSAAPTTPAQAPVIVVKQFMDPGAPSFSFWERRHLSHLRARARR
jgi:hypothetical protein